MRLGFSRSGQTVVRTLVLTLLLIGIATPAPATTVSTPPLIVTDFGSPSTFLFTTTLGPPFVSLSGPTIVSLTVSGTLTDGGTDGVSLTPFPNSDGDGDGIPEVVSAFAGFGSPTIHLLDLGPASSVAGAYGPFSVGPIAGPAGPLDQLLLRFSFTLSGGGDSALLSATLTVDEAPSVPWTASLWLVAGGIGTIALASWRRR